MPISTADAERKAMQRFVVLMRELDRETLPEGYFDELRMALLKGATFAQKSARNGSAPGSSGLHQLSLCTALLVPMLRS